MRIRKIAKLLIFRCLFIVPTIPAVSACAAQQESISCKEVHNLRSAGVPLRIIDVRSEYEFELVRIPEAANVPLERIDRAELPKDELLVLYCLGNGCDLSSRAVRILTGLGHENARALKGGLLAWQARGLPLAYGKTAAPDKPPLMPSAISPAELKARLEAQDGIYLLDLRPPLEFAAGHIPGARNLPLEELELGPQSLCNSCEIAVYDRLPERSRRGARRLSTTLSAKVRILSGGAALWAAKGYPLITHNEHGGK